MLTTGLDGASMMMSASARAAIVAAARWTFQRRQAKLCVGTCNGSAPTAPEMDRLAAFVDRVGGSL